ncbi:hypothetical protein [Tateyamaria sp.]|uniref:hypothetical protein n=1 Tax=Tateyamaria sp. TaxID=1929288 RepID=UPI003B217159
MTPPPDHDRAPGRSGTEQVPATAADLRDLATWLKQRLDGMQGQSGAITEQILEGLAELRADTSRLAAHMDAQAQRLAGVERALHRRPLWAALGAMLLTVLVIGGVVMALPGLREAVQVEIFGFQGAQEPG